MLVSKRSSLVKAHAGKWQTRFGGHVVSGHGFIETAINELQEEAGLIVSAKHLILVEKGVYEDHKHFYESYMLIFDPAKHKVFFNDGEVEDVKWMNFAEYNLDKEQNPQNWCNGIDLPIQQKIVDYFKTTK